MSDNGWYVSKAYNQRMESHIREENIIGRLIIQPELDIGYSENYWNGEQPEYSSEI